MSAARTLVALAALLALLAAGGADGQPRPVVPGARVYLVPVGQLPEQWVGALVGYYRTKLKLVLQPLPPLPLDRGALDYARQQVVAEEVIALLKRRLPKQVADPGAVVIGLTTYDMYIRGVPSWEWAFAFRADGHFAVVSSARMDPANWGERGDALRLRTRLRKMLSKNLGIMVYDLPQSRDRRSVLYGPILSLADLDSIGEDF